MEEQIPAPRRPTATSAADGGVHVTVEVTGPVGERGSAHLDDLLASLLESPQLVVVDLAHASCRSHRLLRQLCRFRAERRARGRDCRLRGLHGGVAPDLEHITLDDLFAVYDESRRAVAS